jgi:uncharacterized protein (DUF1697 family)
MTQCIALLRGINVGRAKRIAMAELRELIAELGFSDVRTLLNSGNALFLAARPDVAKVAAAIEAAIETRFGFAVPVVVVTAPELNAIVAENTLHQAAGAPSKFLVAFVADSATLAKAKPLLAESWAPDAISIGSKAVYLWCANGVIESRLVQAFSRVTGEAATTRNWATVLKLQAVTVTGQNAA